MSQNESRLSNEEAGEYLTAAIAEAHQMAQGAMKDLYVGVEVALRTLDARKCFVTSFRLDFGVEGIRAVVLDSVPTRPKQYNHRGIWAVLYTITMPRLAPYENDPLRVSSITITHGQDPTVTFDRHTPCGLPLSLTEAYDSELFKQKVGYQAP